VTIECYPIDAVFLLTQHKRVTFAGISSEYLPGGSVDAKIYSVAISTKDGADVVTIVLRVSVGKGTVRALSGNYVTQTGAEWDGIEWSDISAQIPIGLPPGALEDIVVTSNAADQIAYINANDFGSGDPLRSDPNTTDPVNLIKDAVREVVYSKRLVVAYRVPS
jgi:hypothetical protein